jgi:cytochrome c
MKPVVALLTAGLVFLSGTARAEDGADVAADVAADVTADVTGGLALARQNCMVCHAIDQASASPLAAAPPFRDIALLYDGGELEDALNEGVATEHPAMPDWQMTPEQARQLAAFVMSLATAGKRKAEADIPLQP